MASKPKQKADTEIKSAAGLEVTSQPAPEASPVEAEVAAAAEAQTEQIAPAPVAPVLYEHLDVQPSAKRPEDGTVAATLVDIGVAHNLLGKISLDISKLLPKLAAEPELHGFLQRTQNLCGDFRHALDQLDYGLSEHLREAMANGISAAIG